jgi:hypothetical protein
LLVELNSVKQKKSAGDMEIYRCIDAGIFAEDKKIFVRRNTLSERCCHHDTPCLSCLSRDFDCILPSTGKNE